ncbi:MAG: DUF3179 domain-containing protein [Thiogranum sp.]|nr:DUF3179 domain-containing protein [Thiogranum sp.]
MKRLLLLLVLMLMVNANSVALGEVRNGFDLSGALIPEDEILSGGPPREGIPAIDRPKFMNAVMARSIAPSDRVLGIVHSGVAKAYPVSIMNWHEIVNDTFGDEAIVVTYCPLCGTGIAYFARAGDQVLKFGVSGLLYNSDMLLYDRQTESLWSQIRKQAISGPMKGERLQVVPMMHTSWQDWRQRHPASLVLSTDTGYSRDYTRSPYAGYEQSGSLYFPVRAQDQRYHPKEWVLGVEINGEFKAYPFVELEKTSNPIRDTLGGQDITVEYDKRHRTAVARDASGDVLPAIRAYWFAWYAFHPETGVYEN